MEDAQVVDFKDRDYWSLSQLSRTFGPARETIAKRLLAADVRPAKKRHGHDVYHIVKAAEAILSDQLLTFEGVEDPDKLPPKDRKEWYQGNNEKNKYLRESSKLIPAGEVAQEMATIVKICVRTIETLPDILEMKCRLPADAIELVENECDNARIQMAKELAE